HRGVERVELVGHAPRAAALGVGRGPEAEELAGDAALAQPRQIDVAEQVGPRRHRAIVAQREVVAELVHQLGGVGVQVEHAAFGVERARLVEGEGHGRREPQRSRATSSTASALSTRLNGGMTYTPWTRCLTAASASCAIRIPSARAAGPPPTLAMRSRYSVGMPMPGTSLCKNSALRCDASGRMPTITGKPSGRASSRKRSRLRGS